MMTVIAGTLAVLLLAFTVLPLMPLSHGFVRVGDFPRQQVMLLAVVAGVSAAIWSDGSPRSLAIVIAFAGVAAIQGVYVARFTPLWRKQSVRYDPAQDRGRPFRLAACNVKMSNRQYARLTAELEQHDPDIVILMEVDNEWVEAISGFLERYPEIVAQPQENSYGLLLASKFRLSDASVECLLTDGVPSIITTVHLDGDEFRFRLYAIHPEPPVPYRSAAGRDGETSLVALRTKSETLPVLVTGDLNDVAWSKTTERFRQISQLLDPRIGRQVFSTFDARYPFIRWPLDHLFHSGDFRLVDLKRLRACGSDHFPVLFELALCATEEAASTPEQPDGGAVERARELVDEARQRDEEPIGTDWED